MKALVILALPLVVGGLGIVISQRDKLRKLDRMLSRPKRSIANVSDGEIVAIEGRVVPSDAGTIEGPLTGKKAVWVRSEARTFDTVHHRDVQYVDFLVDDGSGARARVRPTDAHVAVEEHYVGWLASARPPTSALREELATPRPIGRHPVIQYVEAVLGPSDHVYVVGLARAPRDHEGAYRSVESKELVFAHDGEEDGTHLFIGSSKRALAAGLRLWFLVGLLAIVSGLALMAVGAASWAGLV